MILTLPWPPSVNRYWRHPTTGKLAGRHLISEEGRRYRATVKEACWDVPMVPGRIGVAILASPPDARRRDLDNLFKSVLDSLVHAAVIEDDSLIDALSIVRGDRRVGGQIQILIEPMSAAEITDYLGRTTQDAVDADGGTPVEVRG